MAFNVFTPQELNPSSDRFLVVSECGTIGTSKWDSKEDFITKVGVEDDNDLCQDRFRVDRKKLEHMLVGNNEAPELAETFFEKLIEDTNTVISWPSKLKVGAKSKKDPHVRVTGRAKDVEIAKKRIINVLNTRCNRVTMKMDVSYTDHSHIIGKGGLTIKRVMEETRCHVHFPDSNRSNPMEKSNQVSIAGDIEDVERARSRVRNLTPLVFCFELSELNFSRNNFDHNTPYIVKVQQQYNVQVTFRTRPKVHTTIVTVKGVEWEVQQVKQATMLLVEYMCESLANQISIQMSMEISPNHHVTVMGKNYKNLNAIIQNTNTQIMFCDPEEVNIPTLKKSHVTISGNIQNVYSARQQLMGSLPIVLMFDLSEETNGFPFKHEHIEEIQESLNVMINVSHKVKQNILTCTIKGIERFVSNVYRARNRILGIRELSIVADIPATYFLYQNHNCPVDSPNVNVSDIYSTVSSPWQYSSASTYNPPFVGMVQQPQFTYNSMHGSFGSSGYHSLKQFSSSSLSLEHDSLVSISSNSSLSSPRNGTLTSHSSQDSYGSDRTNIKMNCLAETNAVLSEVSSTNYHGTSVFKETNQTDIDENNLTGTRTMQMRPSEKFRVQTNLPDKEDDIWKSPTSKQPSSNFYSCINNLNRNNFVNPTPTNIINKITNYAWNNLTSLLTSTGLEKYVELFVSNEIDLSTFPSLNDHDLIKLGVIAFGARRKMMLIISELNKQSGELSVAPSAERKSSSSTLSNHSSPKENW